MEPDHQHDWQLAELRPARRGMDRVMSCWCGAEAIELSQAALRDERPPLG